MSHCQDMEHVAELIRLCASTMRMISRTKNPDTRGCPFRHVVRQLEDLSDEIKDIAEDLPPDWKRELT